MINMQLSIPSSREKPQKTNDNLGNFYINETNIDGAPEAILEQILYI